VTTPSPATLSKRSVTGLGDHLRVGAQGSASQGPAGGCPGLTVMLTPLWLLTGQPTGCPCTKVSRPPCGQTRSKMPASSICPEPTKGLHKRGTEKTVVTVRGSAALQRGPQDRMSPAGNACASRRCAHSYAGALCSVRGRSGPPPAARHCVHRQGRRLARGACLAGPCWRPRCPPSTPSFILYSRCGIGIW
jgi:hypothetical protein